MSIKTECGEVVVHHAPPFKVQLTYFKDSGKYYSKVEYETKKLQVYEIFEEVRNRLITGDRPGLIECLPGENEFRCLVELPDHPIGYPCLINPSGILDKVKAMDLMFNGELPSIHE